MSRPIKFGLILFIILFLAVIAFGLKNEVEKTNVDVPIQEDELQQKAKENSKIFSGNDKSLKDQAEQFNEVLKVGDVTFTVSNITSEQNIGGVYGQNADDKFLIVSVSVLNEGIEPLLIDPSLFELVTLEGQKFAVDGVASIYANVDTNFFLNNLQSGVEEKGYVIFDIPKDFHDNQMSLKVSDGLWGGNTGELEIK